MTVVDPITPNPERGIFGCFFAATQYGKAKSKLPEVGKAIDALSDDIDRLLTEASGMYYKSTYGPTGAFRASAKHAIERLEGLNDRIIQFIGDMRENFLQESPPSEKPISFFLSYSHKDRDFAERFASDLRARGHTVWRDEENIGIGEALRRSIEQGIESARFLIFLVSKSSVKSTWCQRELDIALDKETDSNTVVLPVVIEKCRIPPTLKTKRCLLIEDYPSDVARFLSMLPTDERRPARG